MTLSDGSKTYGGQNCLLYVDVADALDFQQLHERAAQAYASTGRDVAAWELDRAVFPGPKWHWDIGYIVDCFLRAEGIGKIK